MPFKKHKPEEIIGKLREAEIVWRRVVRPLRRVGGSLSASRPVTGGARNLVV